METGEQLVPVSTPTPTPTPPVMTSNEQPVERITAPPITSDTLMETLMKEMNPPAPVVEEPKQVDAKEHPIVSEEQLNTELSLKVAPTVVAEPVKPAELKLSLFDKPEETAQTVDYKSENERLKAYVQQLENQPAYVKELAELSKVEGFEFDKWVRDQVAPDVSHETLESLYGKFLDSKGMDEDSKAVELDKIDSMTYFQKEDLERQLREEFATNNKPKGDYAQKIKAEQEALRKEQEQFAQFEQKAYQELDQYSKALVGQEIGGHKLTAEQVTAAIEAVRNPNNFDNEKGFNTQVMVEKEIFYQNRHAIIASYLEAEKAKWIAERSNPSPNTRTNLTNHIENDPMGAYLDRSFAEQGLKRK